MQRYSYNITYNHSGTTIVQVSLQYSSHSGYPVYIRSLFVHLPKSYTFEILGCLQAVTPLLKFMPQFHSVTPLICSGSQETGQAGASGESQPWVPKGQGETQAARPNREQLQQAAAANRFAETLRQKDREKSVTCRKRERNSNSAFTRTFPFPNSIFQNPIAFAELSFHASSGSRRGCIGSELR